MKMKRYSRVGVLGSLLMCVALSAFGCTPDVLGQVVAATGDYVGSMFSIVTTRYLEMALDVPAAEDEEHPAHEATPMHEHDH